MKLNDMTKGALLCLGLLILMAIAGTCDYQDAVHFDLNVEVEGVEEANPDTLESAYEVMKYVQAMEKRLPQ